MDRSQYSAAAGGLAPSNDAAIESKVFNMLSQYFANSLQSNSSQNMQAPPNNIGGNLATSPMPEQAADKQVANQVYASLMQLKHVLNP